MNPTSAPRRWRLRFAGTMVCAALSLGVSAPPVTAAAVATEEMRPAPAATAARVAGDDREEIEQGRAADRQIETEFGPAS